MRRPESETVSKETSYSPARGGRFRDADNPVGIDYWLSHAA